MSPRSNALIVELNRNQRLMGTCPACNENFRLADASPFDVNATPSEQVNEAIAILRQRIKNRQSELAAARLRMTKRAENTAQAVNLGKIIEKIVPSFPNFSFSAGDCRALFEPIDYMIFSGLTSSGSVDALYLADVKSGSGRLTRSQRSIKTVVENGKLRLDIIEATR
jgi:predicted Holliday junction resolvase-like endonuclease